MKATTKAHLAVLGTNLFFAVNFTLVKMISPSFMGAYAVNVFRVGISMVLFWLFWLFGKTEPGIQKKDWARFIFCAICGIVINQTFFIKGLTMTSAIHASLLILITPILVSFFALWALKEKFTVTKALGLFMGVGGAAFLVLQKELTHHATNYLLGDFLIFLNASFYAVYFIAVKSLMQRYTPLHVIRWIFTISFILILAIGWNEIKEIHWEKFTIKHFIVVTAIVVTGTFLAYFFTAYGLQQLGASVTGTYIYTQPVFAVLIAIVLLDEHFTWQKGLAAVFIFAGVYLVGSRKKNSGNTPV